MSILSYTADTLRSGLNLIEQRQTAKNAMEAVVGSLKTRLSNIFDGGFAGMSDAGTEQLKVILSNYVNGIEDAISKFDEKGNIENALKGTVQEAAQDFIAASKQLLQAYVSQMRVNIDELQHAYQNYIDAAQNISNQAKVDANSIRMEAAKIKLD